MPLLRSFSICSSRNFSMSSSLLLSSWIDKGGRFSRGWEIWGFGCSLGIKNEFWGTAGTSIGGCLLIPESELWLSLLSGGGISGDGTVGNTQFSYGVGTTGVDSIFSSSDSYPSSFSSMTISGSLLVTDFTFYYDSSIFHNSVTTFSSNSWFINRLYGALNVGSNTVEFHLMPQCKSFLSSYEIFEIKILCLNTSWSSEIFFFLSSISYESIIMGYLT